MGEDPYGDHNNPDSQALRPCEPQLPRIFDDGGPTGDRMFALSLERMRWAIQVSLGVWSIGNSQRG